MTPQELDARLKRVENQLNSILKSDRAIFDKDIELQEGRTINRVYAGRVLIGGGADTPFPAGWSAVKNSTGNYTVTHNLGIDSYAVLISFIDGSGANMAGVGIGVTTTANSFTVDFALAGPISINHAFHFTLLK